MSDFKTIDTNVLVEAVAAFLDDGMVMVTGSYRLKMPEDLFIHVYTGLDGDALYKLTFKGYWIAYQQYLIAPRFYESRKVRET